MKYRMTRILVIALVFAICITIVTPTTVHATQGSMLPANLEPILNSTTLNPQKTGYQELDGAIAGILAPYDSASTYAKLKALYDWTAQEVKYSWEFYSKKTAPAYDCFTKTYHLTYQTGLQESIPKDMVYRSYHSITDKRGVCYDYAILFAVMARYLGLEAYVHTGYYYFEPWSGISGAGHHGWTEIVIDGQTYVFDPQRENRYTISCGYQTNGFFGIPWNEAWRYNHATQDFEANKARDASMLSVSAPRYQYYNISAVYSPSGTSIAGTGSYLENQDVALQSGCATPVRAWYDTYGNLLYEGPVYQFKATTHISIIAMFDGDYFLDVPAADWYTSDVNEAAARKLVLGTNAFTFDAGAVLTRAMAVQFLARIDQADTSCAAAAPFGDVDQSQWYADAVNWAYENNITNGISDTEFSPNASVSRQDFVSMIVRYISSTGSIPESTGLSFVDATQISPYASGAIAQAVAIGLINGYPDGTIRPHSSINRAEATTALLRTVRYLETN